MQEGVTVGSQTVCRHLEGRRVGTGERGASYLKAIIWLAVVAAMIFFSIRSVPVFFNEYEFQDDVQTAARYGSVTAQSPHDIRDALLKQAQDMNLPLKAEDIQVTKGGGNVTIDAKYSVTVDLGVYQWTLNFHPSASNNAL